MEINDNIDAKSNLDYWRKCYADDLARGRDPCEFGMRWMAHQIVEWEKEIEHEATVTRAREAIAALTAAAEVGGDRTYNAEQNLLGAHYEIERLRAELEAERNSQISAVNGMLAAEQREAATIERCAQVAETWGGEHAKGFSKTPEMHTADEIAAAIRALKDKPCSLEVHFHRNELRADKKYPFGNTNGSPLPSCP